MSECSLLPETQKKEPETWAPCPAVPLTFKVTLRWERFNYFPPYDSWGHWGHIPEVCRFVAIFEKWLHGITWSFSPFPLSTCLYEASWGKNINKGYKVLGSSDLNGINDTIISQKKKQWVDIYNAYFVHIIFNQLERNSFFFFCKISQECLWHTQNTIFPATIVNWIRT